MKLTILNGLADSKRLQIVELLSDGPLSAGEIGERLRIRQPQTSKHLRVLLEAGVVEVYAEANRRIYQLRLEPFQQLHSWLERYRIKWEGKFDNLEQFLQELQKKNNT
ncbi:metalloregulator ArsR/SmtB family transcription factor [Paenibacillus sp. sptzw28]|uniref:ArsR/SmtB family transcription factor n=1 Tax=Paenibacillus sp. sptzw28 TaxID=715179 RepID=UPI001C6F521E|nr:metalloregulator ArsR/SmtB family transcription factor [Paenibacillus sp. sptzw28]QYR21365.1 metalloregulator ArsR/SmtB family transcription factor [Paenibacillus sp. sptzw28]